MKNSKRFNEYLKELSLIIYINENIQRIVENRDKDFIARHLIDSINAANRIAEIYRYPYPSSEFFGYDDFNISGHEALIEYARGIHDDTLNKMTEELKIFRPV